MPLPALPAPPAMSIEGDVIAVHSRWTSDSSRIVTEATVHTATGDVVVSQLGGSVDGIGMITMPGPELLQLGMRVAIAAHRAFDGSLQEHVVLDSARVMAYPPNYVRTGPTKAGRSLYWESGCVLVTVDSAGTKSLANDREFDIIDAAIDTWNNGTAQCSYMQIVNNGRQSLEVGRDRVNLIKIRDDRWARPAVGDDPERVYSPNAAGLTTAVFVDDSTSDRDGAIVDADIEINNVNFSVTVDGAPIHAGAPCDSELQNTLTHELGHLLGLEHPCLDSGDPPRVDDKGAAVPTCNSVRDSPLVPANAKIMDATMYNFQDCGETKKESLSSDEITAICEIYPTADDPGSCESAGSTDGGCCSASGQGHPEWGMLLAGATLLTVLRRRKIR